MEKENWCFLHLYSKTKGGNDNRMAVGCINSQMTQIAEKLQKNIRKEEDRRIQTLRKINLQNFENKNRYFFSKDEDFEEFQAFKALWRDKEKTE